MELCRCDILVIWMRYYVVVLVMWYLIMVYSCEHEFIVVIVYKFFLTCFECFVHKDRTPFWRVGSTCLLWFHHKKISYGPQSLISIQNTTPMTHDNIFAKDIICTRQHSWLLTVTKTPTLSSSGCRHQSSVPHLKSQHEMTQFATKLWISSHSSYI